MNRGQMPMSGHQGSPHQNHVQSPIGNFFPNQHMQFGGQQYYQGMHQAIPSFFHPQLQYNMGFNPADPRSFHINQQIHHPGQMQQNNSTLQNNQQMPQQDFRMPPHMMQNFPNNMGSNNGPSSAVLCASNLNEDKAKPDDLFTLFGVYGDVQRVKILYEKRDTALIEFQQPQQAEVAIKNLNNKKLYGKELKLRLSKFQKVNMPKEGADTYNLTKEYLNSPLHRYRKSGSKNYLNIYEPCDVLHLSNIPEGKTEDDIKSIFEKHGTVKQFKFFKDTKMALIKVENIEEAIHCLIKTHNHRMSANQHLRVSFSKGYLT